MFLDYFESIDDLKNEFDITDDDLVGVEILYACYQIGSYQGSSIVFLKKDQKFFIVDAGHCSCHGLEGQWDPIETNETTLKMEIDAKSKYSYIEFESFIEFCKDYFSWKY